MYPDSGSAAFPDIRDCAIVIRRGGSKTRGGGGGAAQCKLTALGRGVTCKFLGKWGRGGATEKLTLRLNYQRYFTKSFPPFFPD